MKHTYTLEELDAFVERADTLEKCDVAAEFIRRLCNRGEINGGTYAKLNSKLRSIKFYLLEDIPMGPEERNYSPSAPWNAPGMRVSDFL